MGGVISSMMKPRSHLETVNWIAELGLWESGAVCPLAGEFGKAEAVNTWPNSHWC